MPIVLFQARAMQRRDGMPSKLLVHGMTNERHSQRRKARAGYLAGRVMPRLKVAAGDKFGLLTIISEAEPVRFPSGQVVRMFLAKCECGLTKTFRLGAMRDGRIKSCGCLSAKIVAERNRRTAKHGDSYHPLFTVWRSMINRCTRASNDQWCNYGGRGIKVCDKWMNSFKDFLSDIGDKPAPGMSIDRINNNGNYEPGNVRWATPTEQARNTRNTVFVVLNGQKMSLPAAAEAAGVSYRTMRSALKRGAKAAQRLGVSYA